MTRLADDDMLWYAIGLEEGERRAGDRVGARPHVVVDPGPPAPPLAWPLDDDLIRLTDWELRHLRYWQPGFSARERQRRARLLDAEEARRQRLRDAEALARERAFLAAHQAHLRAAAQARRRARWARLRGVIRCAFGADPRAKG